MTRVVRAKNDFVTTTGGGLGNERKSRDGGRDLERRRSKQTIVAIVSANDFDSFCSSLARRKKKFPKRRKSFNNYYYALWPVSVGPLCPTGATIYIIPVERLAENTRTLTAGRARFSQSYAAEARRESALYRPVGHKRP